MLLRSYKMYKQFKARGELVVDSILRVADQAYIPFDPSNTDYQEYLKWLAEGNQPLPAEEQQ